jgi:hypothetical protein
LHNHHTNTHKINPAPIFLPLPCPNPAHTLDPSSIQINNVKRQTIL